MAAASPLLETKLYIPKWRPGLVSRPRLIERLDQGIERKLTLVSAPAGFGKTMALAEWLAATPARDRPGAWVDSQAGGFKQMHSDDRRRALGRCLVHGLWWTSTDRQIRTLDQVTEVRILDPQPTPT